jgi:hypothetical protein
LLQPVSAPLATFNLDEVDYMVDEDDDYYYHYYTDCHYGDRADEDGDGDDNNVYYSGETEDYQSQQQHRGQDGGATALITADHDESDSELS